MLSFFFLLSFFIFFFGLLFMFLFNDNLIRIFISVELVFLSLSVIMILFDYFSNLINGQIFSFFILIFAGIETAIALSIVLIYFRITSRITF